MGVRTSTGATRFRAPGGVAVATVVPLLLLVAFVVLPGCTNSPEPETTPADNPSQQEDRPVQDDEPRPFTPTNHVGDLRVPRRPTYELGFNDRGQLQVPLDPPAEVPPVPLASQGVEGFYVATTDHIEQLPYGLMLYHSHDELKWLVLADPTSAEEMDTLGSGTIRKREGGLEFIERAGDGGRVVGIEQFPAQRSHNRFTVRRAGESQGRTAFGDVLREYDTEVHWVRASAVDDEANYVYTSPLVGRFNPTTRPSEDSDLLVRDESRRFSIWPDGEWRMAVYDENDPEAAPTIYGGTWTLDGENLVNFTQTLPPEYAVDAPMETYAFVYHPEHSVLWLTKLDRSAPDEETAVLPRQPGATTVYQVYRPHQ